MVRWWLWTLPSTASSEVPWIIPEYEGSNNPQSQKYVGIKREIQTRWPNVHEYKNAILSKKERRPCCEMVWQVFGWCDTQPVEPNAERNDKWIRTDYLYGATPASEGSTRIETVLSPRVGWHIHRYSAALLDRSEPLPERVVLGIENQTFL